MKRAIKRFLKQFQVVRDIQHAIQTPQRQQTSEWVVPDLTHHSHLRHYGADLEDRMRAVGFTVELEPWLLTRARGELLAASAYPMRIFHLWKKPQ